MSKAQAIQMLPRMEKTKSSMSRIFDAWIKDYESDSVNASPGEWFVDHRDDIERDLIRVGFSKTDLYPYDIGDLAYDYYARL